VTDDNPEANERTTGSGNKPAAEEHHVALAVDALKAKYESAQADRNRHEKQTLFWARIAGVGVSIYTALTAIIMVASIYSAQQSSVSAIAALNSARIAEDTETRQLRSYLYVTHGSLSPSDTKPSVAIRIHQAGTTPAYKIRLDAQIWVARYLTGELNFPEVTSDSTGGVIRRTYSILYGQEPIEEYIAPIDPIAEAMRAVNSTDPLIGDNRIYLHGIIRYQDIFGIDDPRLERRYEFCFVFHPVRDNGGSERGCEKYNKPG
jgi:hypothetical protein